MGESTMRTRTGGHGRPSALRRSGSFVGYKVIAGDSPISKWVATRCFDRRRKAERKEMAPEQHFSKHLLDNSSLQRVVGI